MEQWEKDYLDNVISKNVTPSKTNKIKIDRRWKEAFQPDGSKLYVPRSGAFRKHKTLNLNLFRLGAAIKKAGKAILIILLAVVILFGLIELKSQKTDSSISWPSFIPGLHVRNTYINGLGLKDMANTLWNIKDRQTIKLNTYIASGYAFSDEEMIAWQNSITEDLTVIEKLTYDKSYSKVVEGHINLLNALQDYINYQKAGNRELAMDAHWEYSTLLAKLYPIFAEALERNGVEHELTESGLSFNYYHY